MCRDRVRRMNARLLRMSSLFLRTLRDDPADAELPSHRLLVRAGFIRRVAPGIFTWLPLGLHTYHKVEGIIRDQMDAAALEAVQQAFPQAAIFVRAFDRRAVVRQIGRAHV